ncbi:MAG: DUF4350 domain-containing protein [Caldilineaceae bacterium]
MRALWLWLEAMGFTVVRNDGPTFTIPADTAVIFIFPNQHEYSPEEAERVRAWVATGGTLLLSGPTSFDDALADTFGVAAGPPVGGLLTKVEQRQPLIPDLTTPIELLSSAPTLDLSQALPVLTTANEDVTLASQRVEQGVVWHLSPHHSLINEQLRDPAQATIVPALLRHAPAGASVLFDTYHLFGPAAATDAEIASLQDWLYRTALGRALLFGLIVTLLFLLLQGRRLGPPLPTPEEHRRREAAEYVTAMANLLRRGQQRTFIAAHHKRRLKRTVGRALTVSPDLDDAAFVRQLQQHHTTMPPEEIQQVATLLRTFESNLAERDLVQAVSQVDQLLARYRRKSV